MKIGLALKSLASLAILVLSLGCSCHGALTDVLPSSEISDPTYAINKGIGLYDLAKYNDSMDEFKKALSSNSSEALIGIGNCELALGNFEEAIDLYEKAIQIDSNSAQAWYRKGNALLLLNRSKEAIECFNQALDLKPGYAEAYANRELAQSARKFNLPIEPLPFVTITINSVPEGAEVFMDGDDTGKVTGIAEPFRKTFSEPEEHTFELRKGELKRNFNITTSKQMTICVNLLDDTISFT